MKKTILVCDDYEAIVDIVTTVLEEKGFKVVGLVSSANIFEQIDRVHPDLILLDLWMPILSGETVIKRLKGEPRTAHIPIIILSASEDTSETAFELGADDFLSKPFEIEELEHKVDQFLMKDEPVFHQNQAA